MDGIFLVGFALRYSLFLCFYVLFASLMSGFSLLEGFAPPQVLLRSFTIYRILFPVRFLPSKLEMVKHKELAKKLAKFKLHAPHAFLEFAV